MDLKQLQALVAIVDHGGVTRAANHMGVSQSALSQSLSKLEAQLQVTLFERTPKGVVLTPYGTAMVARARNILRETRSAIEDIEILQGKGRGHLVIGSGPIYATTLVSEAVHQILITRPDLRITVVQGGLDSLGTELERGEVDVAILTRDETHLERQLTSEPVRDDSVCVMANPRHPLLSKPDPTLADTSAYPWVMPDSNVVQNKLRSMFSAQHLPEPRIQVESSIAGFLHSLVSKGPYLTFLPATLLNQRDWENDLQAVPIREATWQRKLQAVYPRGRTLSRTARQFLNILRTLPHG